MNKPINNPKPYTVVRHTGWRFEDDKNYPCDVLIISGQYWSNGRLSNHWHWKRILPDGNLGKEEYGYGSFEESDKKYEVKTLIKMLS